MSQTRAGKARCWRPHIPWGVGAAIAVLICGNIGLKLWKLSEPPETDLMVYCMGGHALVEGKVLYHDVFDQKPPGLYLIYAAGELLAGYGEGQVAAVNIAWSSMFVVAICLLGWCVAGDVLIALVVGIFGCLSVLPNIELEANQPNTELLLNTLLGFAAVLASRECLRFERGIFGLLSLAATMIKPHAILPFAFLSFSHDIVRVGLNPRAFMKTLSCVQFLTVAIGWSALFVAYFLAGYFEDMWLAIVLFNASYNASIWQTAKEAFAPLNIGALASGLIGPILLFSISGDQGKRRQSIIWIALTVGCYLAVIAPGRFFPHYYQLFAIPWVASLISLCIVLKESRAAAFRVAVAASVFVAVCFPAVINVYRYCTLDGPSLSRLKYKGNWFNETRQVAPLIKKLLQDDEWFFVWGQDPGLYVYTDIWPRTRFCTYFPFVFGRVQSITYPLFFKEIAHDPPDLVIVPAPQIPMLAPNLQDPIVHWLASRYYPMPFSEENKSHLICVRQDSSLDMRTPSRIPRETLLQIIQESHQRSP